MKRKLAVVICVVFLVSGLVRIGAGAVTLGQLQGWWSLDGEAVQAVEETEQFIAERDTNLVGFTPATYFGFIAFMGVTITLGAIGQLRRKSWGLALIVVYLASHAFLFVNFATVNPKVALLALAAVMTGVLWWANRPEGSAGDAVT